MARVFTLILLAISTICLGCGIETPEIRGIVLDEETKQPVEGAWVTGAVAINLKTLAGEVSQYYPIETPHTRTDKQGRFIIPSRRFEKSLFSLEFGMEVMHFGAGAGTVDDREGSVDLKPFLGRRKVDTEIYIKPIQRDESDYFQYLQAQYKYCLTGRFSVERLAVKGGCDEWELNFIITQHERYLEKFPLTQETKSKARRSIIYEQLGLLYKRKGEYLKAIENLEKAKGVYTVQFPSLRSIDYAIERIKKKLEQKE